MVSVEHVLVNGFAVGAFEHELRGEHFFVALGAVRGRHHGDLEADGPDLAEQPGLVEQSVVAAS